MNGEVRVLLAVEGLLVKCLLAADLFDGERA
jgi:hypothetical protein